MTIGDVSAVGASPTSHSVAVFNKQRKQEEAVVGKLLESVEASPRPAPGKGERLNVVA